MRRRIWAEAAGITLALVCAVGLMGCTWEEGQPVGHTGAKQDWQSERAAEQGDALRNRLQITQSDH